MREQDSVALKQTQNGNEYDEEEARRGTTQLKLTHAMTGDCKSKLASDKADRETGRLTGRQTDKETGSGRVSSRLELSKEIT